MKLNYIINLVAVLAIIFVALSCKKLDRFPLDSPSTNTFYETKAEMDLAINSLYSIGLYATYSDALSDNFWDRSSVGNEIIHGSGTSQSSTYSSYWAANYKAIERANLIIENIGKTQGVSDAYRNQALAQARFVRGMGYCKLTTHFGAVPLIAKTLTAEESKTIQRTSQADVIAFAFADLDYAASILPVSYTGQQFFTKGAALGMKARAALYIRNYQAAADAAQQIMNLNTYGLYGSYRDLFLKAGQHSNEIILSYPRSLPYQVTYDIQYYMSRTAGGFASSLPTYELLDSYECTDGKAIDRSSLYNPKNPFINRDPRLKASIVTPGEKWLGYDYQYHPDSTTCLNYNTGKRVANNDCKSVGTFASFNGLLWKKGIDDSELVNYNNVDLDLIAMRYAEILLIYAEAKIESGKIDQSVLDAINKVRARAYGVPYTQVTAYPAVTTTSQADLRTVLRRERRVEFALEGLRYMDIIRWRLAEKVMNVPVLGLPKAKTDYYMPGTPAIGDDTFIDYSSYSAKLTVLDQRSFNPAKNYLWPIPYSEIVQDKQLTQNPNW